MRRRCVARLQTKHKLCWPHAFTRTALPARPAISDTVVHCDLSHNLLESVPSEIDRFAPTLEDLNMGFNRLPRLSGAVGLLRKLKVLNLQNNRIRELPDELALLTELRDLVLSFNSLLELPPAGVGRGGYEARA